jgi:hypothetical protein
VVLESKIYDEILDALHMQLGLYTTEDKTEEENKQDQDNQRKIWMDLHKKLGTH